MNEDSNLDLSENIRSDLWNEMTTAELSQQFDLVLTKISLLQQIRNSTPSVLPILSALEVALQTLTQLIDNRSSSTVNKRDN